VPSQKYPADDNIWASGPSDLTWYYNYRSTPSPAYASNKNIQFVPMLWGASDSDMGTPFYDSVKSQIDGGANISYVLGFNEPDGQHATGGSALPVDLAAARWKAEIEPLKKLGVKLGAPAVTGAASGWTWLDNFFKECAGGCTPDFIPVHWYGNFEGMASHVGSVMAKYPNMTVWVTEYGFPNQDLKATQQFYNMSAGAFDGWAYVSPSPLTCSHAVRSIPTKTNTPQEPHALLVLWRVPLRRLKRRAQLCHARPGGPPDGHRLVVPRWRRDEQHSQVGRRAPGAHGWVECRCCARGAVRMGCVDVL
jgi:hypothetical protein